jgi:hypothetical protein
VEIDSRVTFIRSSQLLPTISLLDAEFITFFGIS